MEAISPVLSGLIRKRPEMAGEADALRVQLAAVAAKLGHVDAVIGLFDPSFDLASIRPKRPRAPDATKPGEMSRFVLDALREASEPIGTPELTTMLMQARGMDVNDPAAYRGIGKRLCMALRRQKRRGTVRSEPGPGRVRWLGKSAQV